MSHFVTSPNTNIPGAMPVINQTFRTICHCAHPTDTNGYREMRALFSSNRSHVFEQRSPCNWWNLREIIVCGRTCRSMQMKGSTDDRVARPCPK